MPAWMVVPLGKFMFTTMTKTWSQKLQLVFFLNVHNWKIRSFCITNQLYFLVNTQGKLKYIFLIDNIFLLLLSPFKILACTVLQQVWPSFLNFSKRSCKKGQNKPWFQKFKRFTWVLFLYFCNIFSISEGKKQYKV